jgi:hypothetical protein
MPKTRKRYGGADPVKWGCVKPYDKTFNPPARLRTESCKKNKKSTAGYEEFYMTRQLCTDKCFLAPEHEKPPPAPSHQAPTRADRARADQARADQAREKAGRRAAEAEKRVRTEHEKSVRTECEKSVMAEREKSVRSMRCSTRWR